MKSKIISLYQFGEYCKLTAKRLSVNILSSIFIISLCFCNVENPQSKNNRRNFSVFAYFANLPVNQNIITTQVGSMNNTHVDPKAILLDNGKVLVVGNGAELFDSSTLTFSLVANRTLQRVYHKLTKLQDGRILISGDINTVEIYDPTTATFSNTGSMIQSLRTGHTNTLLPNGKVLVTGGYLSSTFSNLRSAEIYDPTTGTFTLTGNMNYARYGHNATLLNDETVLIVGGLDSRSKNITTAEIYNPSTGIFTIVSNSSCKSSYSETSVLLSNKNVFIADNGTASSIQIFNLSSGNCTTIQQSLRGISSFSITHLKDGRVLLVGGITATNYYVRELNVFDPNSNTLSNLGNMNQYRIAALSIVLQDGRVLITGGYPLDTSKITEIYTP